MSLYEEYSKMFPQLITCLENANAHSRLSHAFLVHASSFKARYEFPLVLSQLLGCKNAVNGCPDTKCRFCTSVEKGLYPEYFTLSPMGKNYFIKVGDRTNPEPNTLRFFIDRFNYTSGNFRKIGVIFEADRMNDEAQNALLKTLEEPPPETSLILVTGNPAALLPTTRSRCQLLPLPDNLCRFEISDANKVCQIMGKLCFDSRNDLIQAETAAETLITIIDSLSKAAALQAETNFADEINNAELSEDQVLIKRVAERREDSASGIYMRQRQSFLSLIHSFCAQLYLLSEGVCIADLPNPELFNTLTLPDDITTERGLQILTEAEELLYTLRFNVSEELAIRTFAVNIAMK